MNLRDILLIIQYSTIVILFAESCIVFSRWKNSLHSYLLFGCVATLISNLGYLLQMKSQTEEAYINALKLSYAGRVWIAFAFFMFAVKLAKARMHSALTGVLIVFHVLTYVSVFTLEKHNLYYDGYEFLNDDILPRLIHGDGAVHHAFMIVSLIYIIVGVGCLIADYRKEHMAAARKRLLMVILALTSESLFFLLQTLGLRSISRIYDMTMFGSFIGTVFMLIAILSYDLLGTSEIAKGFVIDRISEGIIAVDNEGIVRYYNEPAAALYPEIKELRSTLPEAILRAIETESTVFFDDRIYTPEENDLLYDNECVGKIYALVDDTEHYRYMEELERQKEIADNANAAKSRFLANMSHEIRTPINAVLGMDEMILRESGEEEIRSYAADIMSAGRTLLSLINDILDLSKVEEGRMEIIPVQYELSSLINDLVNMIRDRAAKKGLTFNVEVDEHIPHLLKGDEIRLRQCVLNLLTNAVKYTESGSVTLKVSFEKRDDRHILLGVRVTDTGIGMKTEDMEKLFTPYKRLDERRNRTIEGTGLGLSITGKLLELMGSELKVDSEYGKGSVFSFDVLQEVEDWSGIGDYSQRFSEARNGEDVYHELFHAPDARILVVDDTEMNLKVMQSLLKKTKIGIDTAMSGQEALKLAGDKQYDLIFIDHMMPDMDGIETLKRLRENGANTGTPAVALTANAVSGARQMYLAEGFTDYLSKPVDGKRLERMICRLVSEDKIVPATEEKTSDEQEKAEGKLPDWMTAIDDIDKESGLSNCGGTDEYLSVLDVFHKTADAKAKEIREYYDRNDLENYTIKVHALKSSARIIGAEELSDLARRLEDAGNNKDKEFIDNNTEKLLSMYHALDEELSPMDGDEEDLPPISQKELKEAYQTIYEVAQSMDYELMDDVMKSIREYRLTKEDDDKIRAVEMMMTELDWDGICKLAEEAIR